MDGVVFLIRRGILSSFLHFYLPCFYFGVWGSDQKKWDRCIMSQYITELYANKIHSRA